jgi:hypothetical protein
MDPIHVPEEWHNHDLLTFEQFCTLIHTPPRTVRDWRRRRTGPRWTKLDGTGRLYITVAETRRFVSGTNSATTKPCTTKRLQLKAERGPA